VLKHQSKPSHKDRISIVNKLSARDTRFLQELADSLHLRATWDESDDYGQNLVVLSFDMEGISDDGASVGKSDEEKDSEWESEAGFEAEGDIALNRVFGKYEKAKVVENTTDDFEETYEATMKQKMDDWKTHYYKVSTQCEWRSCIGQVGDQHA
jgi:5'-3' exoribonuclease 1